MLVQATRSERLVYRWFSDVGKLKLAYVLEDQLGHFEHRDLISSRK